MERIDCDNCGKLVLDYEVIDVGASGDTEVLFDPCLDSLGILEKIDFDD